MADDQKKEQAATTGSSPHAVALLLWTQPIRLLWHICFVNVFLAKQRTRKVLTCGTWAPVLHSPIFGQIRHPVDYLAPHISNRVWAGRRPVQTTGSAEAHTGLGVSVLLHGLQQRSSQGLACLKGPAASCHHQSTPTAVSCHQSEHNRGGLGRASRGPVRPVCPGPPGCSCVAEHECGCHTRAASGGPVLC